MLDLVARGIGLGFAAGANPGPFQNYLISTTLAQGWRKSIIVVFAPIPTDIPIILLSVFLLNQLPPQFTPVIQIVGGLFLLWLAYGNWKQFRAGVTFNTSASTDSTSRRQIFTRALLMNWLNPNPYIFWTSVNGRLLVDGLNESIWAGLGFLLGFYVTFLSILVVYVVVFDRLRRLDERVTRAIFVITLVIMVIIGLQFIAQGVSGLAGNPA